MFLTSDRVFFDLSNCAIKGGLQVPLHLVELRQLLRMPLFHLLERQLVALMHLQLDVLDLDGYLGVLLPQLYVFLRQNFLPLVLDLLHVVFHPPGDLNLHLFSLVDLID